MPLPASWTKITVTGTYLNLDGTPATGTVHFTPKAESLAVDSTVVLPTPLVATLDAAGSFSVELPSTTDPDLAVTGWHYRVLERVPNGRDPFYMAVPHDGGPLNMADVLPLFEPAQLLSVMGLPAVTAAQSAQAAAEAAAAAASADAASINGDVAAADASAAAAAASATAADTSADASAASAAAASTSASAASTAETAAEAAQSAAEAAATTAQGHATAAFDSETAALAAQLDAEAAAGTASTKADEAASSAASAAASATAASAFAPLVNHIGTAGGVGFGVGICPQLPAGFSMMEGALVNSSASYGNYLYSDGSVMVWVPAFFYRIGNAASPRYAAHAGNAIDILPRSAYATVAEANAAGYALHRAFYDGGAEQPGFFVDKYLCSNNGGKASSIRLGAPLSTTAAHNPLSGLTGAPGNFYGACFDAAKTRGAQFFPAMRYMHAALALLATAHGQAATSATYCAWYSATTTNFPKGNNVNAALRDVNDAGVTFTGDGYASGSSALTGSGTPFAKTTHNGQDCGITDLNGNMWEVSPGLTCFTSAKTISGATQANPVQITAVAHGFSTGDVIQLASLGGMTQLNSKLFTITVTGVDTFTLDGVDGTAFTAYTSGGSATKGVYYALSTAARARDLTSGATLATDQWSAAGVAAHSQVIDPQFRTDYPNNGYALKYGNAAEQVLPADVSGDGWMRAALGLALPPGKSAAGTALYGQDYFYQTHTNLLCPVAGGYWGNSSVAGVWAVYFPDSRTVSGGGVGFRAASYL